MRDDGTWTAIVVAGDRGKSHPVFGRNKAFLEVGGVPIVRRVVAALAGAESVAEIYVVGPRERLEEALAPGGAGVEIGKPLHIFEQRANLYENVWHTFLETIPAYRGGKSEESLAQGPEAERVVLVTAADMPLLTADEVDEFVSKCDMDNCDYVLGVTGEENLRHYYPGGGLPGIHPAYVHFREENLRQNNLHMVRPFRVINRHYIQIIYDLRYQKQIGNILRLTWEILNKEEGGWGALGYYLLMQLSLISSRLHLDFLRDFIRRRTPVDSVLRCISGLMKTRFDIAHTSFGGATLDIDCERDYEIIQQRFSEWMGYQARMARELSDSANLR